MIDALLRQLEHDDESESRRVLERAFGGRQHRPVLHLDFITLLIHLGQRGEKLSGRANDELLSSGSHGLEHRDLERDPQLLREIEMRVLRVVGL